MENFNFIDTKFISRPAERAINCKAFCLHDNFFFFITKHRDLEIFNFANVTRSFLTLQLPGGLSSEIVNITYLNIWNALFIATATELATVNLVHNTFTIYNNVPSQIVEASWNPSQTFLVLVDDAGICTGYNFRSSDAQVQTYEFVLYGTVSINEPAPSSVYVGWGAHNTQFKGIKKEEESIYEIPQPYSHPNVSWRGNGEMFVVNYWKDNRRYLKLFDASLRPLFASEPYNNLLAPVSFKNKGNCIACGSTDGRDNRIVIYEKNCLVKSYFEVPENLGTIRDIKCHPEGDIIAVYSEFNDKGFLNIYLYGNDTWYLKHQYFFRTNGKEFILKYHWISDLRSTSYKLNILTSDAILMYDFKLETYTMTHDLVAVINGRTVIFTNFSKEIIPPPLGRETLNFERPVNSIYHFPSTNFYRFVLSDGPSIYYKYEEGGFVLCTYDQVLASIPNRNSTISSSERLINGVRYHVSVNEEQELVINEQVLLNNVSSVRLHGNYLLFTHIRSDTYRLYVARVTLPNMTECTPEKYFSREIEQGAKIICVTGKDEVILSLPRGNLETITCRFIAIDRVEHLLSENDWVTAINYIRKLRLNWNLLIDLNQRRFISHIKDFISAAGTTSLLNTIVSEFGTENCLESMYKSWTRREIFNEDCTVNDVSKFDILTAILQTLINISLANNLISIVTLQIKHYTLKAALRSVLSVFRLKDLTTSKRAVAQILLHKHAKDVINASYTLYDLHFLTFVYTECSEDPKIFLPEIEELRTLSPIELRFESNVRGKDYLMATKYLVRMEDKSASTITQFVQKHSTQVVAYSTLNPGDFHFKTVTKLYADYLGLKARHTDAGLILERGGLLEEALGRYKIARNWRKVVSLLSTLNIEANQKEDTLRALAQDLANHKKADEGAILLEHYCGDYVAGVQLLVLDRQFQKALCLANQYGDKELIGTLVEPSLKSYTEDLSERVTELSNTFKNYTTRLLQLRKNKYGKYLQKMSGSNEAELDQDGAELESDTNSEYGSIFSRSSKSTLVSGASRSSSMSSRNRRKLERKKTDLREGGTFEDIALIRQLHLLIVDIFAVGQEVMKVCHTLTDEEQFKSATALKDRLAQVQREAKANIPLIWTDIFINSEVSSDPKVLCVIDNRHELDEQFRTPPSMEKIVDELVF